MKPSKYFSKMNDKVHIEDNSTIVITGATGSLGRSISSFFSNRKVNLILVGRSKKKLDELQNELANRIARIETYVLDLAKIDKVKEFILYLKGRKIDIFYNNAGVFKQPIRIEDDLDVSFKIDYLVPVLFMKELSKYNKRMVFVNTASISYHYHAFNKEIQGLNIKSGMRRYGFLKRLLMMETIYLRKQGINCYLAHPGISYTGLFSKENKAYPKVILALLKLPMKLIFMPKDKASLSLILASSSYPKDIHQYLGPRGLFHSWGYPSFQKLDSSLFHNEDLEYLDRITDEYLDKFIISNIKI